MIMAGAHWWVGGARKTFTGPKRVDAAVFKALAKAHAEAAAKLDEKTPSVGAGDAGNVAPAAL